MSASSSAIRTRRAGVAPVSVVGPVMTDIVSWAAVTRNLGASEATTWTQSSMVGGCSRLGGHSSTANALVSQLAEETDSKPVQCGFESHRGHHALPAATRFRCPGQSSIAFSNFSEENNVQRFIVGEEAGAPGPPPGEG